MRSRPVGTGTEQDERPKRIALTKAILLRSTKRLTASTDVSEPHSEGFAAALKTIRFADGLFHQLPDAVFRPIDFHKFDSQSPRNALPLFARAFTRGCRPAE